MRFKRIKTNNNKEKQMVVNYQNGKIYKLVSPHTDEIYIGSTTQSLAVRKGGHKCKYKRYLEGKEHSFVTSFKLFELGKDDVSIILLESYPCETKEELQKKEREWIEKLDCVNKVIPCRTKKEYSKDNAERIKLYHSKYYVDNQEILDAKNKQWYEDHKEQVLEYKKQWAKENQEMVAIYKKKWYEENKDRILLQRVTAYNANKEEFLKKVECDICGLVVAKRYLVRHKKTKKCMSFVKPTEDPDTVNIIFEE